MKCDITRNLLNDYIDDTLSPALKEEVRRHLEICSHCRKNYEELTSIVKTLSAMSRSISPQNDLWPEIAERIKKTKQSRLIEELDNYNLLFRAAAIFLIISGIVVISIVLIKRKAAFPGTTPNMALQINSDIQLVQSELKQISEKAKIALSNSKLSPENIQIIKNNITIVDDAGRIIHHVLQEKPNVRLMGLYYQTCTNMRLLEYTIRNANEKGTFGYEKENINMPVAAGIIALYAGNRSATCR